MAAKVEILIPDRFRYPHERHRERFQADPVARPMETGGDLWGLRKDGSELPVEIDLVPVECENRRLVVSVIHDRRARLLTAQQLQNQAQFERTIAEVSATLINLPADRVDAEIENGLKVLIEALGGDRASIGLVEASSGDILITHNWTREGFPEFPKRALHTMLPWLAQRMKKGETVIAPDDFPPDARAEREHMESTGLKSSLVVPLRAGGKVVGQCPAAASASVSDGMRQKSRVFRPWLMHSPMP